MIMLVGLVKKNGIIMVDFALQIRRGGGKTPPAMPSTKPASCASGRS